MSRLIEIVVVDDSTNETYRNKATIDQDLMHAMNEKRLSNDKPGVDYVNETVRLLNEQLDDKLHDIRYKKQTKMLDELKAMNRSKHQTKEEFFSELSSIKPE